MALPSAPLARTLYTLLHMDSTPIWVYVVGAITGVLSAGGAVWAAAAAWVSAKSARDAAEEARRPYVWVDVRVDAEQSYLVLVVGNSGPTIASNVRVEFNPPLLEYLSATSENLVNQFEGADAARQLDLGLSSLTPAQMRRWALGPMFVVSKVPGPLEVRITGEGPDGSLKPLTYVIHPSDLAGPLLERHWSNSTVKAIDRVARAIERSGRPAGPLRMVARPTGPAHGPRADEPASIEEIKLNGDESGPD